MSIVNGFGIRAEDSDFTDVGFRKAQILSAAGSAAPTSLARISTTLDLSSFGLLRREASPGRS